MTATSKIMSRSFVFACSQCVTRMAWRLRCSKVPWSSVMAAADHRRLGRPSSCRSLGSRATFSSLLTRSAPTQNTRTNSSPLSTYNHNGIATVHSSSAPRFEAGGEPSCATALLRVGGECHEQNCGEESCRLVFRAADPWRKDRRLRRRQGEGVRYAHPQSRRF
jgi:hypothetical protein